MDRFSKVITTNEMSIKAELPLPNKPKYSILDISFDKFNEFINRYLSRNIRLPLLQATIYDEDVITSQFIMQLWKKLVGNILIRLNYL